MNNENEFKPEYIITDQQMFDSLDPLEGDKFWNMPIQRMLYATPLEVSPTDHYSSFLLSNFTYSQEKKTVTFKLKRDLKFSDSTKMTVRDVQFAILRMLRARPEFPVISEIVGKSDWIKSGANLDQLPSGITLSEQDSSLSIEFKTMNYKPLVRFCLELFAVIPSKCIDPISGKISCKKIPSSGPYEISEKLPDSVKFIRNPNFNTERNIPNEVTFKYKSLPSALKYLDESKGTTVISTSSNTVEENHIKLAEINQKFDYYQFPTSNFLSVTLVDSNTFKLPSVRRKFANELRLAYKKFVSFPESSIFPKLVGGYKKFEPHESNFEPKIKKEVKWGILEDSKSSIPDKVIKSINSLSAHFVITPVRFSSPKDLIDAISGKKIDAFNIGSGFWAADPYGDLKMLFTEGMHAPLQHIAKDEKLQKIVDKISIESTKENMLRFNEYMYSQAYMNVVSHKAFMFISKKSNSLKHLPMGITSPAPYTVMEAALQ